MVVRSVSIGRIDNIVIISIDVCKSMAMVLDIGRAASLVVVLLGMSSPLALNVGI